MIIYELVGDISQRGQCRDEVREGAASQSPALVVLDVRGIVHLIGRSGATVMVSRRKVCKFLCGETQLYRSSCDQWQFLREALLLTSARRLLLHPTFECVHIKNTGSAQGRLPATGNFFSSGVATHRARHLPPAVLEATLKQGQVAPLSHLRPSLPFPIFQESMPVWLLLSHELSAWWG